MENAPKNFPLENLKRTISIVLLLFSSLVVLDIALGPQVSEEEVQGLVYYRYRSGTIARSGTKTVIGIVTDKQEYPQRNPSLYNEAEEGDRLLVYKTKLFEQVTKIALNGVEYKDAAYSFYAFFYLFPIICVTGSFTAFILRRIGSSYFEFFLILSSFTALVMMISLFTNNMI